MAQVQVASITRTNVKSNFFASLIHYASFDTLRANIGWLFTSRLVVKVSSEIAFSFKMGLQKFGYTANQKNTKNIQGIT